MEGLIVSEVFGPTVQGEGPSAGRRCGFVRLGLCNLDCRWCDTPYTWDWTGKNGTAFDKHKELVTLPVAAVVEQVRAMGVDLIVLTGGEPLLQAKQLAVFCDTLDDSHSFEVETNGTRMPMPVASVRYNVSPKLAGSGVAQATAWVPETIEALREKQDTAWKFVVTGPEDVDEVAEFVARFGIAPRDVWVMPEAVTKDALAESFGAVADAAIEHGWNASARLHVLAWGAERGH